MGAVWGLEAGSICLPGWARELVYFGILAGFAFLAPLRIGGWIRKGRVRSLGGKCGLGWGLALWGIGASAGTLMHPANGLVVETYFVVFVAGAASYITLNGRNLSISALETASVGLGIGLSFPLIRGFVAFYHEWAPLTLETILDAYRYPIRMGSYTEATFGNVGNTANLVVLVLPLYLWLLLKKNSRLGSRIFSAVMVVLLLATLVIVEERAALLAALVIAAVVFSFRLTWGRSLLYLAAACCAAGLLLQVDIEATASVRQRFWAAVTVDSANDESVSERVDAIREGLAIGRNNWAFGIGPGAGLTTHSQTSAHQMFAQQFMECGILGLIGSIAVCASVFTALARSALTADNDDRNQVRFGLLVGPAAYLINGIVANVTLSSSYLNVWTVLCATMLALAPGFKRSPAASGGRETGDVQR